MFCLLVTLNHIVYKDYMVVALIIFFAIMAAFLNAESAVIQRYQAGKPESHELFRSNFIRTLSKNPKWIGGAGLQVLGFFFQAAALKKGSLIVVEPLLTIDLVFMMLILHYSKHVPVGKREWAAIIMICSGLSGMLASANPVAGKKPYQLPRLTLSVIIIAIIILIGIYAVRRIKQSSYRALAAGVAAGFSFALVASFTKIVTGELNQGLVYVFTNWELWALLCVGLVSVIMAQNAYGSGPVAISQPTMEIIEPVISIALGIYIFGDMVNLGAVNLFFAVISAVIAGSGIVLLSRSKKLQVLEI